MAPLSDASPIRVALIDDDSGLLTVLERRLGALRWETQVLKDLRAGADDWVTKPCHPEELLARIQAVLRRRRSGEGGAGERTRLPTRRVRRGTLITCG